MPTPNPNKPADAPHYSPFAGLLSYLVPGLGQMYQGRVGKGLLFLVCIYFLFFRGMWMGSGRAEVNGKEYVVTGNVYLPDTVEKNNPWNLPRLLANLWNRPQFLAQFWVGAAAWPAVWQYWTYYARQEKGNLFGNFQRTPREDVLNELQAENDKRWDLGWVYTVIAGVLNVMVIYDAFAGPAFRAAGAEPAHAERANQPATVPEAARS